MPIREQSSKGFTTGGVIDSTPDWLGSYQEGYDKAQQQVTNALNRENTRQAMAINAAAEARTAELFGRGTAEYNRVQKAWADTGQTLPGLQTKQGIELGAIQPDQPYQPGPQNASLGTLGAPPGVDISGNTSPATKARQQLQPMFSSLEQKYGLPPGYLDQTAGIESSWGANTGDPNGAYVGMFQIGDAVAQDFGISKEQAKDPAVAAEVAARLAKRNGDYLRKVLGRDPQPWELYLAHQQGPAGAAALLRNPGSRAVDVLTSVYDGDVAMATRAVTGNGGDQNTTASEFLQKWASKFGAKAPVGVKPQPGVKTYTSMPDQAAVTTAAPAPIPAPGKDAFGFPVGVNENKSAATNAWNEAGRSQNVETQLLNIQQTLNLKRPTWVGDAANAVFGSVAKGKERTAQQAKYDSAIAWYNSPAVSSYLRANSTELAAAAKDPEAYYEANKDKIKGDAAPTKAGVDTANTVATPGKTSGATALPSVPTAEGGGAGLLTGQAAVDWANGTTAAPQVQTNPLAAPGLADAATTSPAKQIMGASGAQVASIPDSGLYMVEPAKLQSDLFELQQARSILEQQYQEAYRFRDLAMLQDVRSKAVQIDAATRLLGNMQAIAAMQAGDDNVVAQTLSRLTNGQTRIQVNADKTYNILYNGRLAYQNITKNALIAGLRSQFDKEYQARVTKALETQDANNTEILKAQLDIWKNTEQQKAQLIREAQTEILKARLKPEEYTYSLDSTNNVLYAMPKNGQGPRLAYTMAPDIGVDGQPRTNPDGTPQIMLKEYGLNSNTVPVQ